MSHVINGYFFFRRVQCRVSCLSRPLDNNNNNKESENNNDESTTESLRYESDGYLSITDKIFLNDNDNSSSGFISF